MENEFSQLLSNWKIVEWIPEMCSPQSIQDLFSSKVLNMWGWICSTCRVSPLVSGYRAGETGERENATVKWKFTFRRRLIKSHHMPWASLVPELQMTKRHNPRDYKQQSSTEKSVTLAWSSLARWLRGWDVFNVLIFFANKCSGSSLLRPWWRKCGVKIQQDWKLIGKSTGCLSWTAVNQHSVIVKSCLQPHFNISQTTCFNLKIKSLQKLYREDFLGCVFFAPHCVNN